MTWIKLDDNFPTNPKVLAAGDLAGWLYVCGLCYCGNALSDGFIPLAVVPRLTGLPKPMEQAVRLVNVGLWTTVDGGYQVHNYTKKQRSKERVEREREAAKVRAQNARDAKEVRANDARTSAFHSRAVTSTDTEGTSAVDKWSADFEKFGPDVAALKWEVAQ